MNPNTAALSTSSATRHEAKTICLVSDVTVMLRRKSTQPAVLPEMFRPLTAVTLSSY
jgi:hypothetical protein